MLLPLWPVSDTSDKSPLLRKSVYTTTEFVELDNKVGADGNKCNFKQYIGIHLIIPPLMILLKLLTRQIVCFASV